MALLYTRIESPLVATPPDPDDTPRPLMADLLTLYAQTTPCPQTEKPLAWLQRTLGPLPLPTPTPALLRAWREQFSHHLAPGEVDQGMEILMIVFTGALRAGAWAPGEAGAVWRRHWRQVQHQEETSAHQGEHPL